jgi:subtilase family serine protease
MSTEPEVLMRTIAALTVALSLVPLASVPLFAQAPNICDWTSPWLPLGPLVARRDGATATVLQDGRVLIVGGHDGANTVAVAEVFDPATDSFTMTGTLADGRTAHIAVRLQDGRVLIAGGSRITNGVFAGALSSAELWDPATGNFTPAATMITARQYGSAVLLGNGKVLVTGGFGPSGFGFNVWLPSAELFDPATGAFSAGGSMTAGRGLHQMTRLATGKVLITGGQNAAGALASGNIYDPATGSFSATGAMAAARAFHAATLLPSGLVRLTGGSNASGFLSSTEHYNPATNSFSASVSMVTPRAAHTATLLPTGKLLIAGGENSAGALASAEISSQLGFTALPGIPAPRTNHSAVLLASGNVLLLGGRAAGMSLDSAAMFDPLFTGTGFMTAARSGHTATQLRSGQVLVVGGQSTAGGLPPLASAELYTPSTRTFALTGAMSTPRHFHQSTLLADGRVLVTGGLNAFSTGILGSAEIFDPFTGNFTGVASMLMARHRHTATLLPNGKVLIAGGRASIGSTSSAELYDPVTNSFAKTGSMVHDRQDHTATLLPNGKVLIAGGLSNAVGGITYSTELYDPSTGIFTQPQNVQWLITNRSQHVATLLASGRVLITGGFTSGNTPTAQAEVYDPASGFFSQVGDMSAPRAGHAAVLTEMPDHQVLVAGGTIAFVPGALETVELFDPATGTFTPTQSMSFKRNRLTATLLLDSTVLVAGGSGDESPGATAETSKPTRCGPAIASLNPQHGLPGTTVSINGSQFGSQQGSSTVTFNGAPASINSWSDTTISAIVPAGATSGPVVVTVNGRTSNPVSFIVGAPDLVIQSVVTAPAAPAPGQTATVTVTARNQGTAPAGAAFVDFYHHSPSPPSGFGYFACSFSGLDPGETVQCTGTVAYATAGTYSMWAQVDVDQIVAESNEANNMFGPQSISVQSGPPDLVQTAVSNPPSSVVIGGSFSVTDTVANAGSGPAGTSTTRYYLSLDGVKTNSDIRLSGSRAVGNLAGGGTSSGTASAGVPKMAQGQYFLFACGDDLRTVTESNETNNCLASVTKVQVTAPDLVESAVGSPPATANIGGSFTATDTVLNQGNGAAGASTTRYYLSADTVRNSGDRVLTGTRAVPSLAPGASSSGSVTVKIPASHALGLHYLLACADDPRKILESDENNNCRASASRVNVTAPDLVQSAVSNPPGSVVRGGIFAVSDTVVNQGTGAASVSMTRYYLSVDAIRNSGDKLLSGTRAVGAIAAGATSSGGANVTVPSNTALGSYILLACADDTKQVGENNEANNCIASTTKVIVQ